MKKKYGESILDERNRPWISETPGGYRLPANAEDLIRREVSEFYPSDAVLQDFLLPLPFSTAPMWLAKKRFVQSHNDYAFAVCAVCERELKEEARLMLMITVVQVGDEDVRFLWRPRLSCCHQIVYGVSPYACVLTVEHALKAVFAQGMKGFSSFAPVAKNKCSVCETSLPCKDEICLSLKKIAEKPPTLEEQMYFLLAHFSDIALDVISPLAETSLDHSCENFGCPYNAYKSTIKCKKCRRVIYCSKACRRADKYRHERMRGCLDFFKIWSW